MPRYFFNICDDYSDDDDTGTEFPAYLLLLSLLFA